MPVHSDSVWMALERAKAEEARTAYGAAQHDGTVVNTPRKWENFLTE